MLLILEYNSPKERTLLSVFATKTKSKRFSFAIKKYGH